MLWVWQTTLIDETQWSERTGHRWAEKFNWNQLVCTRFLVFFVSCVLICLMALPQIKKYLNFQCRSEHGKIEQHYPMELLQGWSPILGINIHVPVWPKYVFPLWTKSTGISDKFVILGLSLLTFIGPLTNTFLYWPGQQNLGLIRNSLLISEDEQKNFCLQREDKWRYFGQTGM